MSVPEGARFGPSFYVVPLVTCFVAAVATGLLVEAMGTEGIGEGLALSLVTGIGYAASVALVGGAFDRSLPEPWA